MDLWRDRFYGALVAGKTVSGNLIYKTNDETPDEPIRIEASMVTGRILRALQESDLSGVQLSSAIEAIQRALVDDQNFEGSSRRLYRTSGQPALYSRQTLGDRFGILASGPERYDRMYALGIPPYVTARIAWLLVGLLQVDEGIVELESGNMATAAAIIWECESCYRAAQTGKWRDAEFRERQSEVGGKRHERRTAGVRSQVLEAWRDRRFGSDIEDTVRWAINQWDFHPETFRRWIRKDNKERDERDSHTT